MLGLMRKNAGSWVVKLLLGGLAVIFAVSFGVNSFMGDSITVLKVNGEEITELQVLQEMDDLFEYFNQQVGADFARQIPEQQLRATAQNRLVDKVLQRQAARRLGIVTLPEELRPYIETNAIFQQDGVFNFDLYQARVRLMGLTPEQFEASLQDQITLEKLQTMLKSGIFVTDDELASFITNLYTRVEGAYLLYQAKDFSSQVKLTPEEIQAYYQEHKNDYMEPAKIRYASLKMPNQHFVSSTTVTEEQLHQAYESNIERFTKPETLMVRSISLEVPPRADVEMRQQVKQKAEDLLAQANAENSDFVELAKRHDQSPTGRHGEPWPIKRQDMAPQMAEQLLATAPGKTALLETPTGFMVVKVESHQPMQLIPLGEVREQLTREIQDRSASVAASRAASQALAEMHRGKTLEQVAQENGLKPEETGFITIDEDLPGMPATREVWDTLLGLKPGQAGVPLNYEGGVLLPVLLEQVPAIQKSLQEVQQQVESALTNTKALALALEAAQAKIGELKAAANPGEAMLVQKGVVRFGPLLQNEEISELPGSDALKEAVFGRPLNTPVIDSPVPVLDGMVVAVLLNRKAPDAEEIEQLKDSQRAVLLEQKQAAAFELYAQDLFNQAKIENMR